MSSSLADQLLKAGLVTEEEVSKSQEKKKHQKRPGNKSGQKGRNRKPGNKPRSAANANQEPAKVENAAARKAVEAGKKAQAKDAEKKAQQAYAEQRRVMNIRISELLKDQPIADPEGDQKFNYVYQEKVRGIYVSAEQREQLVKGELAITVIKAKTKLIPVALVEELRKLDPERFIHVSEADSVDPDDPYSDFQVPDDLTW